MLVDHVLDNGQEKDAEKQEKTRLYILLIETFLNVQMETLIPMLLSLLQKWLQR